MTYYPSIANGCEWCGSAKSRYGKRFCSLSCGQKWRVTKESVERIPQTRQCKQCGADFQVSGKNARKTFCNRSCAASFNNSHTPKRVSTRVPGPEFCTVCGNKNNNRYAQRCSLTCVAVQRRERYINQWLAGEIVHTSEYLSPIIRGYLRGLRGSAACWQCGWDAINPLTGSIPTEIDHIDGDSRNNTLSNLRLICPNCHSLTTTYRNLNAGNGRETRKQRQSYIDARQSSDV